MGNTEYKQKKVTHYVFGYYGRKQIVRYIGNDINEAENAIALARAICHSMKFGSVESSGAIWKK